MNSQKQSLTLGDLIDLVANESTDIQQLVETAHDWEHTRKLEAGKWFLATGTAALIGVVSLLAKDKPPPAIYIFLLAGGGAFGIAAGLFAFWWAGTVSARLARVTSLSARLTEIRPFLRLLRQEDER